MPNKDLIKARKQFVGQKRKAARSNESVAAAKMALGQPSKKGPSDAALRKKFFIKTRTEELKAAGKKVDRKKLAARYESGKVKREEFYAGGSKEKAKRIAASKPKPDTKGGSRGSTGSARSWESTPSKVTGTTSAKDTKGYSASAYMALGQPAAKKSTTTTSTTKKSTTKKSTTTKKPTTSKGSGSARAYEK